MRLIISAHAIQNLNDALDYLENAGVSYIVINRIRDKILDSAEVLLTFPDLGTPEFELEHLGQGHKRIVTDHYKIIYRIEGDAIYVTDIFDTRQDPSKMKG